MELLLQELIDLQKQQVKDTLEIQRQQVSRAWGPRSWFFLLRQLLTHNYTSCLLTHQLFHFSKRCGTQEMQDRQPAGRPESAGRNLFFLFFLFFWE